MINIEGTDALDYLWKKYSKEPGFKERWEKFKIDAEVAQLIYDARIEAGLSQEKLADLVGVDLIAELEEVDYEGNTLPMLQKIASALNLQLSLVPRKKQEKELQIS